MKKYDNDNKNESYRLLTVIAFVSVGLCLTMSLSMISKQPQLQPVSKIDYEYSQIPVSSAEEIKISSKAQSKDTSSSSTTSSSTTSSSISSTSHSSSEENVSKISSTINSNINSVNPPESSQSSVSDEEQLLININTADKEELMKLKGIGSVRADSIINYRNQNGPFTDIIQIMDISGIGEKTFEKIKDYIKV